MKPGWCSLFAVVVITASPTATRSARSHAEAAGGTGVHRSTWRSYRSPDGWLVAHVSASMKHPGHREDLVTIRRSDGVVLLRKDYGSADGEHGYAIQKARWSPDSRFFVYSMASSGGHQPWHFPTDVYARSTRRVRSLDAAIGGVTDPNFQLRAPSVLSTQTMVGTLSHTRWVRVSLTARFSDR